MNKKNTKKKGFTLIELIVVIAILGVLAAVLIPRFTGFQAKAKGTKALVDAKNIATAIDAYYIEHSTYTTTSSDILPTALGSGSTTTATLEADGGFTCTVDGGYKAGRADATTGVAMIP